MSVLKDKWVEIFAGGEQTDSRGVTRSFTESDLDEIVANHNADHPAPIVVGHPKTDDPAFGWTSALKRVGEKLLAKFTQVAPEFDKAVEEGRYRNRSVKIVKSDNGWKLQHVGWLGAAPPAVEGLAPAFADYEPEGEALEFSFREAWRYRVLSRMFRGIREFIMSEHDTERADQVLPEHEINALEEAVIDEEVEERTSKRHTPAYSRDPHLSGPATPSGKEPNQLKEPAVPEAKTFSQEELDAAVAKAKGESETVMTENQRLKFEQRVATHRATVDALVSDDCKLTPAQAAGMPEFMARLEGIEDAEIEFAAEDGKTEKDTLIDLFTKHLQSLPKQLALKTQTANEDPDAESASSFVAAPGSTVDADRLKLHNKALKYSAENKVPYVDAVRAVESAG